MFEKTSKKHFFFKVFPDVFSVVWSCPDQAPGQNYEKNMKKLCFYQKVFFSKRNTRWPARQPAASTGPGSRVAGTGPR